MRLTGALSTALVLTLTVCGYPQGDGGGMAELRFFTALNDQAARTVTARTAELGTAQSERLAGELADAGREVHEALAHQPEPGMRGFAFVLTGCAETGAELTVTDTGIAAKLTGNEAVVCVRGVDFLAIFIIDEAAVPSRGAERPEGA